MLDRWMPADVSRDGRVHRDLLRRMVRSDMPGRGDLHIHVLGRRVQAGLLRLEVHEDVLRGRLLLTLPTEGRWKRGVRWVASGAMVAIGITHFTSPSGFVKIVPAFLPAPLALVYISGFFEIAGGVGLLFERTRRMAGYGLIALYVAVFPANINMAANEIQPADGHISPALMWLRLPFQVAFIALAWWLARGEPGATGRTPST